MTTDKQQQNLLSRELMKSEEFRRRRPRLCWDGSADTGYLSSQTSSMRQPLVMLLTMIV